MNWCPWQPVSCMHISLCKIIYGIHIFFSNKSPYLSQMSNNNIFSIYRNKYFQCHPGNSKPRESFGNRATQTQCQGRARAKQHQTAVCARGEHTLALSAVGFPLNVNLSDAVSILGIENWKHELCFHWGTLSRLAEQWRFENLCLLVRESIHPARPLPRTQRGLSGWDAWNAGTFINADTSVDF